ncbi:oligosaccharide flippase family protein [Parabacteroides sp. OttesenSCG-928-G07]|nr:oligosaccharide flippase family protein [Parabacteroides sp. OttesenSCG-928-G07]
MNFKGLSNYKVIIKNTGYLSALEVFKLIMPFIALPYIIRTVGGEKYGMIVFVQTVISYFSVFINFGLDISAVKDVAILRHDKRQLSELVSSVLGIKLLLWFFSAIVLFFSFFFVEVIRENGLLVLFAFLACFADVLFPVWYFQGVERMKYITLIRFFSILFYTVSVFIFIHSEVDYIFIPLLQSIGLLLSGLLSVYVLTKIDKLRLRWPIFSTMKSYFVESVPFFISRLSVLINSGLAKIVCGLFFSMQAVAAFDLAQKIATAALIPLQMLNQSIYPHLSRTKDHRFARKAFMFVAMLALIIIGFVYILAPYAVLFFAGNELNEAIILLRIMCFYIFFAGMSMFMGTPILVAFGYSKPFNISVIFGTLMLMLCYCLLYLFNYISIANFAWIMGITELSVFLFRIYYSLEHKIFFNGTN